MIDINRDAIDLSIQDFEKRMQELEKKFEEEMAKQGAAVDIEIAKAGEFRQNFGENRFITKWSLND